MGVSPISYTNNFNELANAQTKESVDYKRLELSVFWQKMKELVDLQMHNIERAFMMNIGPL